MIGHPGELLSAFLDGELTPEERVSVLAHLEGCPACRTELADLQTARSMVRSLPTVDVPAWVMVEPERPPRPADRRHKPATWAAAAAAVIVLLIGIATFVAPQPSVHLDFTEIADTHRLPASQDGMPAGARAMVMAPTPAGAQ